MSDDESALYEQPLEFMTSIANNGGECDGQWVVPDDDDTAVFHVACACGKWELQSDSIEHGLDLARMHSGSTTSARTDGTGVGAPVDA